MEEVTMLVSGFVMKDNRKIVRVSFLRGKCMAEGILPDGFIEKSIGFSQEETQKLELYMRANRQEIFEQAKEVNPIRSWLKGR